MSYRVLEVYISTRQAIATLRVTRDQLKVNSTTQEVPHTHTHTSYSLEIIDKCTTSRYRIIINEKNPGDELTT